MDLTPFPTSHRWRRGEIGKSEDLFAMRGDVAGVQGGRWSEHHGGEDYVPFHFDSASEFGFFFARLPCSSNSGSPLSPLSWIIVGYNVSHHLS